MPVRFWYNRHGKPHVRQRPPAWYEDVAPPPWSIRLARGFLTILGWGMGLLFAVGIPLLGSAILGRY